MTGDYYGDRVPSHSLPNGPRSHRITKPPAYRGVAHHNSIGNFFYLEKYAARKIAQFPQVERNIKLNLYPAQKLIQKTLKFSEGLSRFDRAGILIMQALSHNCPVFSRYVEAYEPPILGYENDRAVSRVKKRPFYESQIDIIHVST